MQLSFNFCEFSFKTSTLLMLSFSLLMIYFKDKSWRFFVDINFTCIIVLCVLQYVVFLIWLCRRFRHPFEGISKLKGCVEWYFMQFCLFYPQIITRGPKGPGPLTWDRRFLRVPFFHLLTYFTLFWGNFPDDCFIASCDISS